MSILLSLGNSWANVDLCKLEFGEGLAPANRGLARSLYYFIRLILFSLFSDARMCLSLFSLPVSRPFHQLGLVSKAKSRQTAEILEFVCQASLKLAWMQDKKHTKSKKFRICLPLKLEADLKTGKKADKRQENLKIYAAQEKASSQDVCRARISAKGSQTNLSLSRCLAPANRGLASCLLFGKSGFDETPCIAQPDGP